MHVRGLERGRYPLHVNPRAPHTRVECVLRGGRSAKRPAVEKISFPLALPFTNHLRFIHSGSSPSHGVSSRQQIAEFAAAAVLLTLQRLGDLQLLVERLLALHNTCHVAHTPERPGRGGSCVALRVGRVYRGAEQGSRHGSPVGHNRRPSRVIAAICAVS